MKKSLTIALLLLSCFLKGQEDLRFKNQIKAVEDYFQKDSEIADSLINCIPQFKEEASFAERAFLFRKISSHLTTSSDLKSAMSYAILALEMSDSIKQKDLKERNISSSLFAYANILFDTGEYEKAKSYYTQALELAKEDDIQQRAQILSNMGLLEFESGDLDTAIWMTKQTRGLYLLLPDSAQWVKQTYNLGVLLLNKSSLNEALSIFDSVAISAARLNDLLHQGASLIGMGDVSFLKGEFEKSNYYYKSALPSFLELDKLEWLIYIYGQLSTNFDTLNEPEKALENYKSLIQWKDSLMTQEKALELTRLEVEFESEKAEKDLIITKLELENSQADNIDSKNRANLLVIIILVVIISALAVMYAFRQRQKLLQKEAELSNKMVEEVVAKREVDTLRALLEGQNNERDRIAQDLHDRLGSMLSTLKLQFNNFCRANLSLMANGDHKKLEKLLNESYQEVRKISHDLHSGVISRFGLVSAINDLRDSIQESSDLKIEFVHFNMEERLSLEIEVELFRIIQELLNNVLKHAEASEVSINLTRNMKNLSIIFEDNGKGFDLNQLNNSGLGIQSVESRVQTLGGELKIDSALNRGSTFIVQLEIRFDD